MCLVGHYYYSSIDGVSDDGTRRAIREHKRAHGLPEDGKIRGGLLTTMGLGVRTLKQSGFAGLLSVQVSYEHANTSPDPFEYENLG